jgi:heat shock protein HslJ
MEAYGDSSDYHLALENAEFTLYLDSTDGSFSGNVGPNRYGGKYKLDGDNLSFPDRQYFVTELWVNEAVQQQQTSYFSILMNADICEVIDGKLHITAGDRWMIFYRL